jgi:hypothetical protein
MHSQMPYLAYLSYYVYSVWNVCLFAHWFGTTACELCDSLTSGNLLAISLIFCASIIHMVDYWVKWEIRGVWPPQTNMGMSARFASGPNVSKGWDGIILVRRSIQTIQKKHICVRNRPARWRCPKDIDKVRHSAKIWKPTPNEVIKLNVDMIFVEG